MERNRLIISETNDAVILEDHSEKYFSYVDRDVDYVFTFSKDNIDKIIAFLEKIK